MKNQFCSILVFAISIFSLSVGNILLKLSMDRYAVMNANGMPFFSALLKLPALSLGVVLMLVQFGCTITLFKWGWEATVVIPVMGLSYVVMGLIGRWMIGEVVTPKPPPKRTNKKLDPNCCIAKRPGVK